MSLTANPHVLLFDVGGVLVQLSGVKTMLEWMGETATSEEMWHMWLHSTPVRVVAPLGEVTPASPSKTSSDLSFSSNTSSDVFQSGTNCEETPISALVARVRGVTGGSLGF